MQKIENFLYDFIGVLIPGFFLCFSVWTMTVLLVKVKIFSVIYERLPFHDALISIPKYPLIKGLIEHKLFLPIAFVLTCYVLGNLLTIISGKIFEYRWFKTTKVQYYPENKEVFNEVKKFLKDKQRINIVSNASNNGNRGTSEDVEEKDVWIVLYRWANASTSLSDFKLDLQLLLSKMTMSRSLSVVSVFGCLYSILILFTSLIGTDNRLSVENIIYMSILILCTIVHALLAWGFKYSYLKNQRLLYNESLIVLFNKHILNRGA